MIRFAFVTDSHYHPSAQRDYGPPKMLTHSRRVLEAMVSRINQTRPDFVVHGGDLLCGGGSFELPWDTYVQSVQDVAQTIAGFDAPAYYVPGNHDCDSESKTFAPLAARVPIPEILEVMEVAPRLRLALANVYHNLPLEDSNGVWTDELDRALTQAAQRAATDRCALILVLHTWVLPGFVAEDEDPEGQVVKGADRLIETVTEEPAIIAIFTGHRHLNRIRMFRDFLIVDTDCLIGYPMGFREIQLREDGYLVARFHQLDLPQVMQASYDRSTREVNDRWEGELHDRETEILLPRLRALWS